MCLTVLPQTPVRKLIGAAQNVQQLLDDGTLLAAFTSNARPDDINTAVVALDQLFACTKAVADDQKAVSPFIRYRREILAETPMGSHLRSLVFSLHNPADPYSLNRLFLYADDYHKRIALDLIAAFANRGESDPHFMQLASDLANAESDEAAA